MSQQLYKQIFSLFPVACIKIIPINIFLVFVWHHAGTSSDWGLVNFFLNSKIEQLQFPLLETVKNINGVFWLFLLLPAFLGAIMAEFFFVLLALVSRISLNRRALFVKKKLLAKVDCSSFSTKKFSRNCIEREIKKKVLFISAIFSVDAFCLAVYLKENLKLLTSIELICINLLSLFVFLNIIYCIVIRYATCIALCNINNGASMNCYDGLRDIFRR